MTFVSRHISDMEPLPSGLLLLAALLSASRAEELIYAQVGQTVTLKPPENYKTQTYYLSWHFGELELAWTNHMSGNKVIKHENWDTALSGNSLVVKEIRQNQFGIYKCKVDEKIWTYKVLRLKVSAEPPSLVLSGRTVTLVCDAEPPNSLQKPGIHWLNPQGEKITQATHRVQVSSRHSGWWTCVINLDRKEATAQINVTVVDLYSPPMAYTSTSSPLAVPCSVPKASWEQIKSLGLREGHWQFFPRSKSNLVSADAQRLFTLSLEEPVSWKANQTRGLTPVSDFKTPNLSLGRTLGRADDRGDYVCTLKFESGPPLSRTVQVNVLEIAASPGTVLISGQQLNLTCGLGVPLTSDLHLKWISPERTTIRSGQLTIPAVGVGNSGKWRCELWRNNTRLTLAVITLKIEPKLSVWMLVIICSVAVIVLLLLLLGFILCRRRRVRVRPRSRLNPDKAENVTPEPIHHAGCCLLSDFCSPKPKGFYRT
ncbi:CD4-1 molecule isoform X1 [Takifugu flavidus]|uniref:CD4-1 molecule isoform X1 n=1 Tax=Takifugu flavidus TaxID=433684 RepID=UPI0025444487|nr:CD4-1 molecule isoform X1 [Takifugu flavidus]XP_056902004.1 CD4-1 molecule isoform X1 [Takifugu flavidus]